MKKKSPKKKVVIKYGRNKTPAVVVNKLAREKKVLSEMKDLLLEVEDVDKSKKSRNSSECSDDSEQNVFVFDYEMSLEDRLKEFAQETATSGPKLLTEKKDVANATKKIKDLLKKRFDLNNIKTPEFVMEEEPEEICSITK